MSAYGKIHNFYFKWKCSSSCAESCEVCAIFVLYSIVNLFAKKEDFNKEWVKKILLLWELVWIKIEKSYGRNSSKTALKTLSNLVHIWSKKIIMKKINNSWKNFSQNYNPHNIIVFIQTTVTRKFLMGLMWQKLWQLRW